MANDRYNITTLDANGFPDLYITGVTTKIAQSWIEELERDSVEFQLELTSVELEEA